MWSRLDDIIEMVEKLKSILDDSLAVWYGLIANKDASKDAKIAAGNIVFHICDILQMQIPKLIEEAAKLDEADENEQ